MILNNVSKRYGKFDALQPLSLAIGSGQTLGLLGPNGAGKTTLMTIMAARLRASTGEVVIGGHPLRTERDAQQARRLVGFLPQRPSWIPGFTALETVQYSAWLKAIPTATRSAVSMEALDKVGLAQDSHKKMKHMSGGMIQRACLAAAIVSKPEVLLLDEPTVGLDPAQRISFRKLVGSLEDTSIVLSTHLVEDIAALSSSILVLDHGATKFLGTPAEFLLFDRDDAEGMHPMERAYMSLLAKNGAPA